MRIPVIPPTRMRDVTGLRGVQERQSRSYFRTFDLTSDPVYPGGAIKLGDYWDAGPSGVFTPNAPGGDFWSWLDQKINTVAALYSQEQLVQINRDRATRGLPPLSPSDVAPQFAVTLSPELKQLLMFGGIGLGAYLLLKR